MSQPTLNLRLNLFLTLEAELHQILTRQNRSHRNISGLMHLLTAFMPFLGRDFDHSKGLGGGRHEYRLSFRAILCKV